jgi:hypothetical protein
MRKPKESFELSDDEKALLLGAPRALITELIDHPSSLHIRSHAFDYYCDETKEMYQVQVVVTRVEDHFLKPFEMEVTKEFSELP